MFYAYSALGFLKHSGYVKFFDVIVHYSYLFPGYNHPHQQSSIRMNLILRSRLTRRFHVVEINLASSSFDNAFVNPLTTVRIFAAGLGVLYYNPVTWKPLQF